MDDKLKTLIGWTLTITIINTILLVSALTILGTNSTSAKSTVTNNATNTQITALQTSVGDISNKVTTIQQALTRNQLTSVTCTGSFYQSFSGFGSAIGSTINMNMSGTSPIRLTCS